MSRYVVDYDEYKMLKYIKEHSHEIFKEHCMHQAWTSYDEIRECNVEMCGLIDEQGHLAKSWDDWKECCPDHCPILKQMEVPNGYEKI